MKKEIATMPKEITETKPPEGEILTQWGFREEDGKIFRCDRPFLLSLQDGPPQRIEKNALVRVASKLANELFFSKKISPLDLPEIFEAVCSFQSVQPDGTWLRISKGDILKLSRKEALALLRERKIREKKGEI